MTQIFGELDHRLSVVKRWGILHTLQNQSVAEHVHNVVRLTLRMGIHWFALTGEEMLTAVMWAHHHDDAESLTGDLPTMIKPYLDEDALERDHKDLLPFAGTLPPEYIAHIVKLADLLEGFHFVAIEMRLGNSYVSNHFSNYYDEIYQFVKRSVLPGNLWDEKVKPLMDSMADERSIRYSRRGR